MAKHGGRRPGAGRPAAFRVNHGDYLVIERSSINEAEFYKPELGRVIGISATELELQIDNEILAIRFPEDGEVEVSLSPDLMSEVDRLTDYGRNDPSEA